MSPSPFVQSKRIIETISDIVNNPNVSRNFSTASDVMPVHDVNKRSDSGKYF